MPKRIAIIDRELCQPKVSDYACQKSCPVNRSGKDCITISPLDKKPLIDEELCIGCGICIKKCPKNAIKVVNLPAQLLERPVHRYGPNLFSLYRLPIPKPGAVIGLIGQNGIGKTTVLNILSGSFKPNTGLFEGVTWDSVIKKFKGTELQAYLNKLAKKELKVAYKPQHVDVIPDIWKGKVKDFLPRLDKKGNLNKIVARLGISRILEKDTSQLSGGELQLLAIAATLLKEADFYFFDEPSSYLDVRKRLLVAKEIRALTEKAIVMTVEHDLTVADYLADYTHILYGQKGVFGVVSKPYGVRVGINTYLDGYIKEENIRFRPFSIVFEKRAKKVEKRKLFLEFPAFTKNFSGFKLKTAAGELNSGEIIGILGPNSIGKTTFIKMLAGEIKPDSGASLSDLKLAYKPQRLIFKPEEQQLSIKDFLKTRTGKKLDKETKKIIKFLGLESLLERKIDSLSGGEMQSVLITSVLAQKKDIMLFDEPSAFLDVEQRLRVAKLLHDQVEQTGTPCFVVDHDLLFIDALANRLIVFKGQPGKEGQAGSPSSLKAGMNSFLKELGITFRRDPVTGRPRANKPDSQLDREQKEKGNYYYE